MSETKHTPYDAQRIHINDDVMAEMTETGWQVCEAAMNRQENDIKAFSPEFVHPSRKCFSQCAQSSPVYVGQLWPLLQLLEGAKWAMGLEAPFLTIRAAIAKTKGDSA